MTRPPRVPLSSPYVPGTLPATGLVLDVLFIAPNRWRKDGKILEATPDERSRMYAMASRFSGIMAAFTSGLVTFQAHLVEPDMIFDVWGLDVPEVGMWKPTTENGSRPPAIHSGAAEYYGRPFRKNDYPFRFFLSPYSILPMDMGDLTWENWSYCPVKAPPGYADKTQTESLDVLGHCVLHQLQAIAAWAGNPFPIPNPDRAGEYGTGAGYDFPDAKTGWVPAITDWLSGRAKHESGDPAMKGMTADRWKALFGSEPRIKPPLYVDALPLGKPVRFGEAWSPLIR